MLQKYKKNIANLEVSTYVLYSKNVFTAKFELFSCVGCTNLTKKDFEVMKRSTLVFSLILSKWISFKHCNATNRQKISRFWISQQCFLAQKLNWEVSSKIGNRLNTQKISSRWNHQHQCLAFNLKFEPFSFIWNALKRQKNFIVSTIFSPTC